jgi:hypothetical protein
MQCYRTIEEHLNVTRLTRIDMQSMLSRVTHRLKKGADNYITTEAVDQLIIFRCAYVPSQNIADNNKQVLNMTLLSCERQNASKIQSIGQACSKQDVFSARVQEKRLVLRNHYVD